MFGFKVELPYIGQGWKGLPGAMFLAYFASSSVTRKKRFILDRRTQSFKTTAVN
jgi:hypothetical protein